MDYKIIICGDRHRSDYDCVESFMN